MDEIDTVVHQLETADPADRVGVLERIDELNRCLGRALDQGGDAYRNWMGSTFDPACALLDQMLLQHDWAKAEQLASSYSERRSDGYYPGISVYLNNVFSRHLIRAVMETKIDRVPDEIMEYMLQFPGDETGDFEWEESMGVGWGIGHSSFNLSSRLQNITLHRDRIWGSGALEYAFYADQRKAVDLLDDIIKAPESSAYKTIFSCVGSVASSHVPNRPANWDGHRDYCRSFEWQEGVRSKIKNLVAWTGYHRRLPGGWTLTDLVI